MIFPVHIRAFRVDDAPALLDVFQSSVRQLAADDYDAAQIDAWAPADMDPDCWAHRMRALRPWIAERDGRIAGYADLQGDGLIDHFFVAGPHGRQGVGRALMSHLLSEGKRMALVELKADVSLAAEPFFMRFGFSIRQRQQVVRQGVVLANARMVLALERHHAS